MRSSKRLLRLGELRLELLDLGPHLLGLLDELGRSSLLALGMSADELVLARALLLERGVASRRSLSAARSSSRSRSRRLFLMAARTRSAFWRMNWMSSMGTAAGS